MPVRPLRKRAPYFGVVPGVATTAPARRPQPVLLVALALAAASPAVSRIVLTRPPGRPTLPRPAKTPLIVKGQPPPLRGSIFTIKLPDRTQRLASFQEAAHVSLQPFPEPRRGAVWTSLPHGSTAPWPAKSALLVRPLPPRLPGAVFTVRVPSLSLRLTAFQTTASVIRRDERRFPGRVLVQPVSRAGAAIITPRVPRHLIVRRDERSFAGARFLVKLPDRTVRLDAFQEQSLLVRRDERRYAGAVWANRVPARTVRLGPFQLDVFPAQRDQRGFAGRALFQPTSRAGAAPVSGSLRTVRVVGGRGRLILPIVPGTGAAVAAPIRARPALILRRDDRRFAGAVFTSHVPVRTVRLSPFETACAVVRRDERGFPGRVLLQPPSRTGTLIITPRVPRVLVARRDERRGSGAVFQVRVTARTVRLSAFQVDATTAQRDQRRFSGRVLLQPPPRLGAAPVVGSLRTVRVYGGRGRIILPVVPGTGTAVVVTPGKAPFVLTVRRDERRQIWSGAALVGHAPARTARLATFQIDVTITQRDERRFAGRVLLQPPTRTGALVVVPRTPRPVIAAVDRRGRPGAVVLTRVPARTQRLDAFQVDVTVVQRDQRRFSGSVWISAPHRPAVALAAPRAVLVASPTRGYPRVTPTLFTAPKRLTLRLAPGLLQSRLFTRQSFPTPGAALFVRPNRPRVVPRLPVSLVVRRDERGFRGRSLASPSGRQNAVAVLHGNPRAKVTLRAGPGASLVLRSPPTATLTLRPQPTAALTFKEG